MFADLLAVRMLHAIEADSQSWPVAICFVIVVSGRSFNSQWMVLHCGVFYGRFLQLR